MRVEDNEDPTCPSTLSLNYEGPVCIVRRRQKRKMRRSLMGIVPRSALPALSNRKALYTSTLQRRALRFGTVWTFLLFRTQRSLIKGEEFFVDRFVWRTRSGQQKDISPPQSHSPPSFSLVLLGFYSKRQPEYRQRSLFAAFH